MNKISYAEFMEGLNNYYELVDKGLKKKANQYIEVFVKELSTVDKDHLNTILYSFLKKLCDKNKYNEYSRGNGRLPYVLDNLLRDYLYAECTKNKMPQLRWYYELYRTDRIGHKYAFDMLEKAYEHEECDQETVNLLFEAHIGILAWGSHHFPEGCILERDKASFEIDTCKSILQNHAVEDSLLDALDYFERLYSCYFKYVDDGRVKDFDLYCIEEQIEFEPINAFFYM